MSSAAAVEEALSEVLPGESEADAADLYGSASPNPHSPLPSPLSATPAPSPLSSLPASSVSSPGPGNFSGSNFPVSPHQTLQNQMMPNSEDPLLSSSPKDFGTGRRRFEFQSYKLITSQNLVDFGLGNGHLTGIVVDNNGEFKIIQTTQQNPAGLPKANVFVQAGGSANHLNPGNVSFRKEIRLITPKIEPDANANLQEQHHFQGQMQQVINPTKFLIQNQAKANNVALKHKSCSLPIPIEQIKEELLDDQDVFLSPSSVPSVGSPARHCRKKPRLDASLGNARPYPSRLRRACDRHWDSSYTPPPILNPSRPGSGIYARLHQYERDSDFSSDDSQGNDGPPPRINIGNRYQATIPPISCLGDRGRGGPEIDHLLWDPGISNALTSNESEFSRSSYMARNWCVITTNR